MSAPRVIGNYELHSELAAGGMASVHLGRSLQPNGVRGLVAIKRLHEHLVRDPEFSHVLLQEARITERIQHPNVVATLDVVAADRELILVMEYVPGETVARLLRSTVARGEKCSVAIAASVVRDTLLGLAAAHETKDVNGELLRIVHRDISPQNIIVSTGGLAKVLDFGIAKVIGSQIHTRTGELKGKIPYMAPEILQFETATPQTDLWAVAVVLWEMLCARRLFKGESEVNIWGQVLNAPIPTPAEILGAPTALDHVVMRGLSRDKTQRYQSAAEMARDIEQAISPASPATVAAWVMSLASTELAARSEMVNTFGATAILTPPYGATAERVVGSMPPPPSMPPPSSWPSVPPPGSWPSERAPTSILPVSAPASRTSARAAWALVAVLVVTVVGLLVWRLPASARPVAGAALPSPPAASTEAPASLPSSSANPPSTGVPASSDRPAAKPTHVRPPAPRPHGPDPCDPPYVVDQAGRKLFKLECVK